MHNSVISTHSYCKQVAKFIQRGINDNSRMKVITIDDDVAMTELTAMLLRTHGFDVITSNHPREAILIVREKQPQAVILDLMMPEMDGFSVIEALRANPETATIPVIVATAKELTPDEKNRLSGHIQALLQKGDFLNDEFLDEVKALLK